MELRWAELGGKAESTASRSGGLSLLPGAQTPPLPPNTLSCSGPAGAGGGWAHLPLPGFDSQTDSN